MLKEIGCGNFINCHNTDEIKLKIINSTVLPGVQPTKIKSLSIKTAMIDTAKPVKKYGSKNIKSFIFMQISYLIFLFISLISSSLIAGTSSLRSIPSALRCASRHISSLAVTCDS